MGNRGMIHEPATQTLLRRRWTTNAWLICVCAFKGRHRTVMGPSSYTELFFLDEATALSAGHRPCFECRRHAALAFADAFAAAAGRNALRAGEIDAALHRERLAVGHAAPRLAAAALPTLPDGTMIALDGTACLLCAGVARRWSFAGYGPAVSIETLASGSIRLLTPPSTLGAMQAGYRPSLHPSAAA